MRVLIVDDDRVALKLLNHTLIDCGHEVSCAADGEEALMLLSRAACDVVISDWQMPRVNGINLCKEIRRGATADYVYFILLTGHNSVSERVEGLSAGADDFMSKPLEPQELLARLQTAERILSLETRDVAIFSLAKLAESRDPETGAHLERVQGYCRALAQQLAVNGQFSEEIDPQYVRLLYGTSPLHDIGKVGIPDSVLLKPGRLSDREFEIMKTHTTIGAQTLDAALQRFPKTQFLRMARDIAASHHERFDGTGYPLGLKGRDIPLSARIVALADVYDALTSKRVYKPAFAHDIAKSIIADESGSHFDPAIVEAFLGAEQSFISVYDRFHDHRMAA